MVVTAVAAAVLIWLNPTREDHRAYIRGYALLDAPYSTSERTLQVAGFEHRNFLVFSVLRRSDGVHTYGFVEMVAPAGRLRRLPGR